MITGGILIGGNRPWNLISGTDVIQDIFYKNNSVFQSLFTHWEQTLYCTWGSQGSYSWRQETYAQEQTYQQTLEQNNAYTPAVVVGTAFL